MADLKEILHEKNKILKGSEIILFKIFYECQKSLV